VQPGSTKGSLLHELAAQLTDVQVPTERQRAGRRYGQWITEREAGKRARHPRGLIEYGVEGAAPQRFAEGGRVEKESPDPWKSQGLLESEYLPPARPYRHP
jgi:hypothetical protein